MAYVKFSRYAPCGFLIVPDDGDSRNDAETCLIQTDWDYPGVAQSMGWSLRDVQRYPFPSEGQPCHHDSTDGTVTCRQCGLTATDFISAAYAYIRDHADEPFPGLDDYLPEVPPCNV